MGFFWRGITLLILILALGTSCTSTKRVGKARAKLWEQQIDRSEVFGRYFMGFSLMDATSGKILHEYAADRYFTPASNVKILTLYTCLRLLPDSIPALRYEIRGDSLLFWGTGDPSPLYPPLGNDRGTLDFLRNQDRQLFFCPYNFQDEVLGAGWSWDDYPYYFQPEKSALPLYGNLVHLEKAAAEPYRVVPQYFSNLLVPQAPDDYRPARLRRRRDCNIFEYPTPLPQGPQAGVDIPFRYSDSLLLALLSDTLHRPVALYPRRIQPSRKSRTRYGQSLRTAYRLMMQESDNFISEQLLLTCAGQVFDTLNTRKIIDYARQELLADLPDPVRWVDGSGLSRYNLLTPRSVRQVLYELYQLVDWELLTDLFPAGGQSGTIVDWYGGGAEPYVYAKTGTLSGVHCLSGYLVAQSGKVLIFSFMHNNYVNGSRELKEEMEKVLRNLYLTY